MDVETLRAKEDAEGRQKMKKSQKVDKERERKNSHCALCREGAHPPRTKKKATNKLTDNFERLSVEQNAQTVLDIRGGGGTRANLFVCAMREKKKKD